MKIPFLNVKKNRSEITEYRKQIKLYDVFTFFNELDLLEIRLNILYPYVDYFVIIESTETFSGLPKRLYYEENKERYKKFQDKILHYVIDDVPATEAAFRGRLQETSGGTLEQEILQQALTSDNVPPGQLHWLKEFYQKESIRKALVQLADNDICYVSDVDEIWNPAAVVDIRKDDIFKLKQLVYVYYFNNRSSEPWAGTLVTKYKNIKHGCLNHLRTASKTKYTYIKNGGWHFTNQGGADQIRKKLESYGHQEFNNLEIKSQIEKRMEKNQDFIGRKFTFWLEDRDLPAYLIEHQQSYTKFFKPATRV
jgi:beta-1,4-mannosyl-glycoprotein beta-1,4-N-acetylglucosaminyltransferase